MSEATSSEPNAPDLLERLERSLRSAAGRDRRTLALPGFALFLAPTDAYLLNLAVPVGDLEDWDEDWDAAIAGMTAAFEREARRPRLEFFAELHPELGAALERHGFRLEHRAPVMVLTPSDFAASGVRVEGYRRLEHDTPELLEPFMRRQGVAYGGSETDEPVFLPGLRAGLEEGRVWAAGLVREGGFVSGATLQLGQGVGHAVGQGVGPGDSGADESTAAELAGVWTHPDHRRRKLAFTVCRQLLSEYFAAGHEAAGYGLVWLSAAPGAQGLYEGLGFREVGTQFNYGLPSAAPGDEG